MRPITIAVEIGSLDRLQIRLLELVASLERLLKDRIRQQVAHLQPHQRLSATSSRRVHFGFQTGKWSVLKLKQRLAFHVNRINQGSHETPQTMSQNNGRA